MTAYVWAISPYDQKYCRCLIERAKCRPKWIMNIVMHERLHVHWQLYLLNYNEEL